MSKASSNAAAIFGANVIHYLERRGKSAYWLTKELGASPGAIYPILRGKVQPAIGTAAMIADTLGVRVDTLLKPPQEKSENKS